MRVRHRNALQSIARIAMHPNSALPNWDALLCTRAYRDGAQCARPIPTNFRAADASRCIAHQLRGRAIGRRYRNSRDLVEGFCIFADVVAHVPRNAVCRVRTHGTVEEKPQEFPSRIVFGHVGLHYMESMWASFRPSTVVYSCLVPAVAES